MASRKTAKEASIFTKNLTAAPSRDAGHFERSSDPAENNTAYTSPAALAASQPYAVRHNYPSS